MRVNFKDCEAVQRVTGMSVEVLLKELEDAVKQASSPYEDSRIWTGENVVVLLRRASHGGFKSMSMVLSQYPHEWDKEAITKWAEWSTDATFAYYREWDKKTPMIKKVVRDLFIIVCTKERYDSEYATSDIKEHARRAAEADDYSGISHYDSASDRGW